MADKPDIPTSGGSYIVKDGKLQQVHATKPAPPVQEHQDTAAERAPAPAATKKGS